ncbi:helix-turn-helix domain-containing protein [Streptomyces sp. H39-S7]|uniref:helix-turn-helix domain-containing protein n=1 Tax=Streptomyces sp. H39-S7 TaxID=3004357 RepID=UPI0022AEA6D7|nr:helix-turn-helix transcriptional regulator [Streptomyces sp. H39-S7]MCZ4122774.1 helix-turn-helix transcriptional regulator [Streptomyces sp. H39-S7]
MGRIRGEIDYTVRPERGKLGEFLRSVQESSNLSTEQLAQAAGLKHDRVRRLLNGQTLPHDVEVVLRVVDVNGRGSLRRRARVLWMNARAEAKGKSRPKHVPEALLVSDFASLVDGMRKLQMFFGYPSARALEAKVGPGMLPHTTLERVLAGDRLPTKQEVMAFARAVDLPQDAVSDWGAAWDRADARARKDRERQQHEQRQRQREGHGLDAVASVRFPDSALHWGKDDIGAGTQGWMMTPAARRPRS